MIRVAVAGASGRMGREALRALVPEHGFEVVGEAGRGRPVAEALNGADVLLDLSHRDAALANVLAATSRGLPWVSGVTGIAPDDLAAMDAATTGVGGLLVPNFALGAVLMMRFAEIAARWIPDAEIVELHHERKEDAPSGTALLTAERIAAARAADPLPRPVGKEKVPGARGGEIGGVRVHSVRLPGLLAHQEVIFGAPGEALTIRHDSFDRASFMPGVRLCLRAVRERRGMTVGMDAVLFGP